MKQLRIVSILVLSLVIVWSFSAMAIEYNESPMLRKRVETGELPPVGERLPKEPLVIEVEHEIGKYGGTITLAANSPSNWAPANSHTHEFLLMLDHDLNTIPNIAQDWEFSEDGTSLVIYLREGMKWSDGATFTADDMLFWYEDVILNDFLTPVMPDWLKVGNDPIVLEKIDDYTVRYKFPVPYFSFIHNLDSTWARGSMNMGFLPSHALKQYHIKYNPDADKLAQERGYEEWWELFAERSTFDADIGTVPLGMPTLGAWIVKQETEAGLLYERNPYYFKVDAAGNQLPYIDKMKGVYGLGDTLSIMAGEVDLMAGGIAFSEWPILKSNEEQGGYKAWLGEDLWISIASFFINQSFDQDEVMGEILRNVKFRQALSLAIDREDIAEVIGLGFADPHQVTLHETVPGYDPNWARAFTEYDPEKANQLLDEIGLDKRNSQGWRLRPDGKELSLIITLIPAHEWGSISELCREYWRDVGIKAELNIIGDIGYFGPYLLAGNHHILVWVSDNLTANAMLVSNASTVNPRWPLSNPNWAAWLTSNGEEGVEPPDHIKELDKLTATLPYASPERQAEIFAEIGNYLAEYLPTIGTIRMKGKVAVANKDLGNVREELSVDNADTGAKRTFWVEQYYWKSAERRNE